jgi:hypothetical protein
MMESSIYGIFIGGGTLISWGSGALWGFISLLYVLCIYLCTFRAT